MSFLNPGTGQKRRYNTHHLISKDSVNTVIVQLNEPVQTVELVISHGFVLHNWEEVRGVAGKTYKEE